MKFEKPVRKTPKQWKKKLMIRIKPNYEFYFFFLPIAIPIIIRDKISDYIYHRLKWDEKRAEKVLNKTLPKILSFDEDGPNCYYSLRWGAYPLANKAPKFDKRWARKFSIRLLDYLKDEYENKDYTKKIEYDGYEEWVIFTEINEGTRNE